ncbi:MAG: class I SAM-dependent methyltransferase [Anaerolineales bacterium]
MSESRRFGGGTPLPDHFATVASDIMDYVACQNGVWRDVGTGTGGLGLALAACHKGVIILLDPDEQALGKALAQAAERRLLARVVPVIETAERIPLPAEVVDIVVSRGSFFFWKDRAAGLREIYRVLCPGGKAMIGGGLGSRYPKWAREEFVRRQRHSQRHMSAEEREAFALARHPETFRRLAREAGLPQFDVIGTGRLAEDSGEQAIGI